VRALIVRQACRRESNWRARQTLAQYLGEHGVMALTDVDTRALTRHLRQFGALRGVLSTVDLDPESLRRKALASPTTSDVDLVAEVTCAQPHEWAEPVAAEWISASRPRVGRQAGRGSDGKPAAGRTADQLADQRTDLAGAQSNENLQISNLQLSKSLHVVAYDCGIKRNILRQLVSSGCRVTVVPADTTAEETLALQPDGVFLSNGPGDPEMVPYTIASVQGLLGRLPVFGICLGHQVLGLALGGRKRKLKFGHHGSNHPVKDLRTGQIAITAQNHNFVIDVDTIQDQVELTHVNLYDGTVEGMRHRSLPVFSVQYHPEAAPGPHDANPLFGEFVRLMERGG
jgi:carbamoyl-phosphate synthase small subunit